MKTSERNARAQAQLISDLLDVSRIVAGKLHFEFEVVDLKAIVASVVGASKLTGLGSTFSVRLPRVTRAVPSPEEDLVIESQLENRLILVIDDDADILELVRYALEHRGARVDTVQTAAAALDRLAVQRYDVLVSDLGLPEKDGLTLMREVRAKSHALRELRTVALTGYASEADAQLCREAGFELHLVKPISPWELARSITRLLEQPVAKPAAAGAS